MHRDLKPNNLGLTKDGELKIFDFGLCRILPEETTHYPDKTYRFTRCIGTRRYMAPEVARGEEYNAKSDVYSFGLICYEVLSLEMPHGDIRTKTLARRVAHEGLRPSLPQSWPRSVKTLSQRCWNERLSSRPTMSKVSSTIRSTLDCMVGPSEEKEVGMPTHDGTGRTERSYCSVESDEDCMSIRSL